MTSRPSTSQASFDFDDPKCEPQGEEGTRRIVAVGQPRAWRVRAGGQRGAQELQLETDETLLIGSGKEADLRVLDPAVSRRHCRVTATRSGLHVEDLESTNGVFVAGVRVPSAWVTQSGPGFVIGRTAIYVRAVSGPRAECQLPGLVGDSAGIKRLSKEVRCYAPHDVAVLIQGETGSGKDVIARAIHELSGRRGPFVALNIGAVQDSLADAELFGHKKGAFTGAVSDRKGAFEQAHGGTLFLDEVGDTSPAVQVKLLRAIEEKRIRAVGAEREVNLDVRVVAASWAQLDQLAAEGRFRWDLYHRLSTAVLRVPALRERRSDIPLLARHFLRVESPSSQPCELTEDALRALREHEWKGNVRELRAVLKRAVMLCANGIITENELELRALNPARKVQRAPVTKVEAVNLLHQHAGNVSAAARAAGLPRSTFRNLLASGRLIDSRFDKVG